MRLGLIERTPNDHTGGIVRNNFIYRDVPGDAAVYVGDTPGTQVLHNTILISRNYANTIEDYTDPRAANVREPHRVSVSAHYGRRDRQQRPRRQRDGSGRRHRLRER